MYMNTRKDGSAHGREQSIARSIPEDIHVWQKKILKRRQSNTFGPCALAYVCTSGPEKLKAISSWMRLGTSKMEREKQNRGGRDRETQTDLGCCAVCCRLICC